jgi:hypothetical protein
MSLTQIKTSRSAASWKGVCSGLRVGDTQHPPVLANSAQPPWSRPEDRCSPPPCHFKSVDLADLEVDQGGVCEAPNNCIRVRKLAERKMDKASAGRTARARDRGDTMFAMLAAAKICNASSENPTECHRGFYFARRTRCYILTLVHRHRHIQKIQGPLSLGHAHHRNRRGFIEGFAKGGETSAAPSV